MIVLSNDKEQCNAALQALRQVIDPEIGLNVVDLGLIYQLDFDENEKKLFCRMTLTTQFCPMGESITNAAQDVLQYAFPGYTILIHLVFEPAWDQDMISLQGLNFLNQE